MQAYAHKISNCMLEVTQGDASAQPSNSALQQMQTWVCELSTMHVYLALGNLKNFLAFTTSRLDGFPGHGTAQLSEGWYQGVLVCICTVCLACCLAAVSCSQERHTAYESGQCCACVQIWLTTTEQCVCPMILGTFIMCKRCIPSDGKSRADNGILRPYQTHRYLFG